MQKVDITELRRLWEAANSTDGCSAMEYETYHRAAHNALPALLDELEAVRLEMRRQGSVIAECGEEVRRLTQANGDLRKERDRAVAEAQRQDAVAKGLRAELARLQRNEDCVQRLIVWAAENGWNGVDNSKILDSFIVGLFDELRAELAAHDAALLREVAGKLRNLQHDSGSFRMWEYRDDFAELIDAEADRIEKEAKNK